MYDASEQLPGCVVDPPYNASYCGFNDAPGCIPLNGCGVIWVFPYLILFTMIITFVGLNLFVGVVLAEYDLISSTEVNVNHLKMFASVWTQYDPEATYYMDMKDMEPFVAILFAPLGFAGEPFTEREMHKRVGKIGPRNASAALTRSPIIFA